MQTSPESKWTKGPWLVGPYGEIWPASDVEIADGKWRQRHLSPRIVASPSRLSDIEHEADANAHLIASAPDMAEALEAAPIRSKYHGVNGFEEARFFEDYDAFMAKRRAALAKAEGR